ncbi:cysteine peptidase family C39 domain-containing protein [Methanobacterium alcaliphilum]|uniref:cysteine peptidase family C39 domain-containing protein n=1 Tax=Methanobacterium alcaliphilum TaxID=392018 RepID=UPI00200B2B2D|nr:cysteine peptidase family C39 domain-containing protein [Methanobacterium alcaliphilum]MCK9151175.1 cysteine peptidase family C39 domain-containing protein [Methanobacterium alcaliphilum]
MENILENESCEEKIAVQSTPYNCGPAALVIVLRGMGINCSEQEIANIAGTDETGTSMYGLMCAARSKGIDAVGMRVDIELLKRMDIVFLNFGGKFHYSVIDRVEDKAVFLADPALGRVELTKEYFKKLYTGNALVIKKTGIRIKNHEKN